MRVYIKLNCQKAEGGKRMDEEKFTRKDLDYFLKRKKEREKCPYCLEETFGFERYDRYDGVTFYGCSSCGFGGVGDRLLKVGKKQLAAEYRELLEREKRKLIAQFEEVEGRLTKYQPQQP
jgi:predicted RNA-binding Zn-ribbon protein involved in translation (DUF1610 family)